MEETGSVLFSQCLEEYGARNVTNVMRCVTSGLETKQMTNETEIKNFIVLICGFLVFMMQVGFAMLCAGCVRRKNVSNTLLKNLLDACGAAIAWYTFGFAFAYGGGDVSNGKTFAGTQNFFMTGDINLTDWFFEYSFSATCVTIIAGTLAERSRMSAYVAYSLFMVAFVYPIIVHSIWSVNGFLSRTAEDPLLGIGVLDFSGSGVIHLTGGTTALIATLILGARRGRFHNSKGEPLDRPRDIAGHSISLQTLGCLILWVGWLGFNMGPAVRLTTAVSPSAVASSAVSNTALAGGAAAISTLCFNMWLNYMFNEEISIDITKTINGTLTGLAAVTAGCATLEPWAAIITGMVAGWVYLGLSKLLIRLRIDDAVDAIPVHGGGGFWGLIVAGLLSSPRKMEAAFGHSNHVGLLYSIGQLKFDASLFACQITAIVFIVSWTAFLMFPFFLVLNNMGWMRVHTIEELAGLDAAYAHAQEEDHEALKERIINEFRQYQEPNADGSGTGPRKREGSVASKSTRRSASRFSRSRESRSNGEGELDSNV
ncbi:hypothetical protein MPSEU_000788900 [Mayamaea pseudoterrestris]|nr:hypothetical protein MPSEU_000788900 [Mayamaea pseudoterrestris]